MSGWLLRVEVRGGVAVGRVVAAADVAARHAHPQVHPPTAHAQAVLAALAARRARRRPGRGDRNSWPWVPLIARHRSPQHRAGTRSSHPGSTPVRHQSSSALVRHQRENALVQIRDHDPDLAPERLTLERVVRAGVFDGLRQWFRVSHGAPAEGTGGPSRVARYLSARGSPAASRQHASERAPRHVPTRLRVGSCRHRVRRTRGDFS